MKMKEEDRERERERESGQKLQEKFRRDPKKKILMVKRHTGG